MSLPLIDCRIKITADTDAVVQTVHLSSGKDKSEILREVLHRWAADEIRASMMLHGELKSKGLLRDYEGVQGR